MIGTSGIVSSSEGADGPRDNSAPTVVYIYLVAVTISGPLSAQRRGSWTAERPRESPSRVIYKRFRGKGGWDECKFQAT